MTDGVQSATRCDATTLPRPTALVAASTCVIGTTACRKRSSMLGTDTCGGGALTLGPRRFRAGVPWRLRAQFG